MIANNKRIAPRLTFGLGRTSIQANVGEVVKVWQKVLFNKDVYDGFVNGTKTENLNYFEVTPTTAGTLFVEFNLVNKDKTISINSQPIILEVK